MTIAAPARATPGCRHSWSGSHRGHRRTSRSRGTLRPMTRKLRWLLMVAVPVLAGGLGLVPFAPAQPDDRDLNYSLIEEGLYMGGDVRCRRAAPTPSSTCAIKR